ncbi:hypothetical protein BUZ39_04860, partial [Staphylococcus haemolyticus]
VDNIVKSSLLRIDKATHDTQLSQIVEETEAKLNDIKFNKMKNTVKIYKIEKEASKNKNPRVNSKLKLIEFNGNTLLPNTGIKKVDDVVPLTQLSLISGLFLLLISKRRKNVK